MKLIGRRPVIGFCVSEAHYPGLRGILTKRLEFAPGHFTYIRFQMKDLDFKKSRVRGERFEKKTGKWIKGMFPFPNVIFMQSMANRKAIKRIENVIGPNVFNSFIFDKWEGYNILAKNINLRNHLPHTQLWKNHASTSDFINQYNCKDILLKPVHGYGSNGIFRIKFHENKNIEFFYKTENTMEMLEFKNFHEFWPFLATKLAPGTHIIQQSIETVKQNENVTDIRLNMNKNRQGQWEKSLLLFRVATNKSVVIPKSIVAYNMDNFMNSSFYDQEKMGNIEKDILNLGLKICQTFDRSEYHMGDVGIDLGLDENGHLWIFEVNPLPFPTHGSVGKKSLTGPVDYALYLASKIKNRKKIKKRKSRKKGRRF